MVWEREPLAKEKAYTTATAASDAMVATVVDLWQIRSL
jgi:hypothetical protein